MNRLPLLTLQFFLVTVTALTVSHWNNAIGQTAGAAQEQTGGSGKVEENSGADQANRVSNTGIDVTESQNKVDFEGADPQKSQGNFSFDTEKDPAVFNGTKNRVPQ